MAEYVEPEYRIERDAASAEIMQALNNIIREIIGLPILRTGAQAAEEERRRYLTAEQDAEVVITDAEVCVCVSA